MSKARDRDVLLPFCLSVGPVKSVKMTAIIRYTFYYRNRPTVARWSQISINEVNLRRARLILGWVTASGFNSRCRTFISVYNQLPTPTQPGHHFLGRRNEYQPERELMFMFAICRRPSVCLSSLCRLSVCRLTVTFVHPSQAIEIFGNIFTS